MKKVLGYTAVAFVACIILLSKVLLTMQRQGTQQEGSTVAFLLSDGSVAVPQSVIDHFPALKQMFLSSMREGISRQVRFKTLDGTPCSDKAIRTFVALLQNIYSTAQTPSSAPASLKNVIENARLSDTELSELSVLADMYLIKQLYEPLSQCIVDSVFAKLPLFKQDPDLFFATCLEQFGESVMQKCMELIRQKLTLHHDGFSTQLEKLKGGFRFQKPGLVITGTRNKTFVWLFNQQLGSFGANPAQTIDGFCEYVSPDGGMVIVENRTLQVWRRDQVTGCYVYTQDLVFNNPDLAAAGFGFGKSSIAFVSHDLSVIVLVNQYETIMLQNNVQEHRYDIAHRTTGVFVAMSEDMRRVLLNNHLDHGIPTTIVARLDENNHYVIFASLAGSFSKTNNSLDRIVTEVLIENANEVKIYQLSQVEHQDARVLGQFSGRFIVASDDLALIMVKRSGDAENHYRLYVRDQRGSYTEQEVVVPGAIVACSSDLGTLFVRPNYFEQSVCIYKRELPLGNLSWEQTMELFMIQQEQPQKFDYMRVPQESSAQHADIFASLNTELRRYLIQKYLKNPLVQ